MYVTIALVLSVMLNGEFIMSKEFFKQVPPDEWEKLMKDGFADAYDANEIKNAHGLDHELTNTRFRAIMDEKERRELEKTAKTLVTAGQKISQKLQSKDPNDRQFSAQEILEVKDSLKEALKLLDCINIPSVKTSSIKIK